MTILPESPRESFTFVSRRRDRRLGVGELMLALMRTLGDRADPAAIRGSFEDTVRRMVPVRSCAPARRQQSLDQPCG